MCARARGRARVFVRARGCDDGIAYSDQQHLGCSSLIYAWTKSSMLIDIQWMFLFLRGYRFDLAVNWTSASH